MTNTRDIQSDTDRSGRKGIGGKALLEWHEDGFAKIGRLTDKWRERETLKCIKGDSWRKGAAEVLGGGGTAAPHVAAAHGGLSQGRRAQLPARMTGRKLEVINKG